MQQSRPMRTTVRMIRDEYARPAGQATLVGVSIPALLLETAEEASAGELIAPRTGAISELVRLRRLVANVANNINQIAKAANTGQAVPYLQLSANLAYLRQLSDHCTDVISQLVKPRRRRRR